MGRVRGAAQAKKATKALRKAVKAVKNGRGPRVEGTEKQQEMRGKDTDRHPLQLVLSATRLSRNDPTATCKCGPCPTVVGMRAAAGGHVRTRARDGAGHGKVKGCKVTKAWANAHLQWCPWGGWGDWHLSGASSDAAAIATSSLSNLPLDGPPKPEDSVKVADGAWTEWHK